ncbi:hypothetical protein PoB_004691900 [Plakobranchus ocellatus]|uniref:Uncharacterized protein n=1 Tax=Plakobranchus ocellatus TaxID=259542 RepID=A0AAV4BQ28_9GAST|nr:hypothetical protein PoB_004691900 [Plakobranchus ocellatus]
MNEVCHAFFHFGIRGIVVSTRAGEPLGTLQSRVRALSPTPRPDKESPENLIKITLLNPNYINLFGFCISCPQQGDLRLSGPPSGQNASGGARTHDRMVPAGFRAGSLVTVPPTPRLQ